MKIPDKLYEVLKWLSLTAIPALTTLYGVIGTTLNIPYTQQVLMIMPAISTCIGALIGISTAKYYQDQSRDNFKIADVMAAVEKYMAENNAQNADVPEE